MLTCQCWKNLVTGDLHLQVHPCGARQLVIDPLPAGASKEGALYPDGGEVTDLKEVRETLYKLQRPGIAPEVRVTTQGMCDECLWAALLPSRLG